jgi:hypothetical protein
VTDLELQALVLRGQIVAAQLKSMQAEVIKLETELRHLRERYKIATAREPGKLEP